MDNNCNNSNNNSIIDQLFRDIYRNKYLHSLINSHLSLRNRGGYYMFRNGSLPSHYDDLEISNLFFSTCLAKEKLFNFKQLFINQEKKETEIKNNSSCFTTYYQDWIDFRLQSYTNIYDNIVSCNDDNDFNLLLVLSIPTDQIKVKEYIIDNLVYNNGLNRKRFQLLEQLYPKRVYKIKSFDSFHNDDELFNHLVENKRIGLVDVNNIKYDTFFDKNKDKIRCLSGWDDIQFALQVLKRKSNITSQSFTPLREDLLIWILSVSPLLNFDRIYNPKNMVCSIDQQLDWTTAEHALLYGVKILKPRYPFFYEKNSMVGLMFTCKEIYNFMLEFYPDFLVAIIEPNPIRISKPLIQDIEVAKLVVNHPSFDSSSRIVTMNVQVYQYLFSKCLVGFNFDYKQTYSHQELILLFELFSIPSATHVGIAENLMLYATFIGDLEIIKLYYNSTPTPAPMTPLLGLSFNRHTEVYEYLFKAFQPLAIDFTNILIQSIKERNLESTMMYYDRVPSISEDILATCTYTLVKSNNKNIESSIKILQFFKKLVMTQGNSPTSMEKPVIFNTTSANTWVFEYLLLIDPEFYHYLKPLTLGSTSLLGKFQRILNTLSFTHIKLLLKAIEREEPVVYQQILDNLESIIFGYIREKPSLKILLYLFQEYKDRLNESILEPLIPLALETKNFILIDILLHKTKIRLIECKSKQHEHLLYSTCLNKLLSSNLKEKDDYLNNFKINML
ncbi:hypothetical protein CYY_005079 [Polysphondylium violaceum]|uniref:Uncharacterized protein n=1 Tax=Polysphondylium violaceum TaxID=133409 RepID=A0A8J4V4K2_9MYCE|nr:hypothetical protein CYY_005079 [Polysphondylium violaceum]